MMHIKHCQGLAHDMGILSEISAERAAYWRGLAPAEQAFHAIIKQYVSKAMPTDISRVSAQTEGDNE